MSIQTETWRERYYELEYTIEQLIIGFENVLDDRTEARDPAPRIRKVVVETTPDRRNIICCIADGMDMEYNFDLLQGDILQYSTGFTRRNSSEIFEGQEGAPDRCIISVRNAEHIRESNVHLTENATHEVIL